MGELLFHNSHIVSVSLAVCAVLATIGAMMLARNMLFMSTTSLRRFLELRFRPTALRYTEEFECLLGGYQEKARLLDAFTSDFSVVFNEVKWAKAMLTLDQTVRAHHELCGLLQQGESRDALCLAEFLIAAGEELAPWKYRRISDEWASLANWELQVHSTICAVVKNLPAELQRSRGLGMSRGALVDESMKVLQRIRENL